MSYNHIVEQSIFRTKSSRIKHKKVSKKGLTTRGGSKKPMDIVTQRLLNGKEKRSVHYVVAPQVLITHVMGRRIVLGNERTYSDAMIKMKNDKWENSGCPKKEVTVKKLERVEYGLHDNEIVNPEFKPNKTGNFKFQKHGGNGRRVQRHSESVTLTRGGKQ